MAPQIILRSPLESDMGAMLALNNEHGAEVGDISLPALERLLRASFHARVTEERSAFLIGLEQGAGYESPNYLWFSERFDRFAYIDRVLVAVSARRNGLARALYTDFFEAARRARHPVIACEVNSDPPNPESDAFHAAMGFIEIGRAHLPERKKSVRYLVRKLSPYPHAH